MAMMPTDPNALMGAVQQQRGGAPMVKQTTPMIVKAYIQQQYQGDRAGAQKALSDIAKLADIKMITFLQAGNTVFMINRVGMDGQYLPPFTADVYIMSRETPELMPARVQEGLPALKQMGYKRLTIYTDDPMQAQAWQQAGQAMGAQVNAKPQMMNMGGGMAPAYRIEVAV